MKYYYNDKLIRTSNRVYTHALIDSKGRTLTCSATFDGCAKEYKRRINRVEERIANYLNAVQAEHEGKTAMNWKVGRKTVRLKIRDLLDRDKYMEYIEIDKRILNDIVNNYKIVKLEAR